jgi:hypothetical protein
MIIFVRPDGHLCINPEEKCPEGVTVLMAIYGEMAIYGQEAAGVALAPSARLTAHLPQKQSCRGAAATEVRQFLRAQRLPTLG